MENELNTLNCKKGDIVLVCWDDKYKVHTPIISKDIKYDYFKEGVFNTTTLGYLVYIDENVVVLSRNMVNEGLFEDFIKIPVNLIKSCTVII